ACSDFYVANAPERLGLVTIATVDLAHLDQGVSRASIVGETGVLYATEKHLYLASRHWWWWPWDGQRDWTYVHEFDIEDPATAGYVGSGGVEGNIGDQFAMDEKDGYLRIATSTATETYDAKTQQFHVSASSRLSVLAPDDTGALSLVGEIPSLVDGERLMSTRFIGDKGYAVTFRNFDPLVTLDLSDPAHPRKVAELTITGFSSYLQPIDDDHLLAIGEELPLDSSGRPDWNRRALQLSLFDVSDLSQPKRTAQALVGTAWAYSEALWDHHAFNWYRPDPAKPGLLAIPFSDWIVPGPTQSWYDSFVSDVRVFSVDPGGATISPVGSLGMNDVYIRYGSGDWSWWYRPWVRRSVMATDQGGNTFVYAISDAGLRAAALSNLSTPLGTTLLTR
ncbi:MAG: beta-propeller domain-containing protein, partial [Myxococcales bacterium]|nr:beta-propeller domain-containing protein [Myxococcales bacterium]